MMEPALQPLRPDPAPNASLNLFALHELVTEVRRLNEQLRDVARQLHTDENLSVPERGLLMAIRQGEPRTVPVLARDRGVSRQFVQVTVNDLQARGLVEMITNPRHKRSRLIRLTEVGEDTVRRVMKNEGMAMSNVAGAVDQAGLKQAVSTLRRVRDQLGENLAASMGPTQ